MHSEAEKEQKATGRPPRPVKLLHRLPQSLADTSLRGCPFLCQPGVNYDLVNEYLEHIHLRRWVPNHRPTLAEVACGRGPRRPQPASIAQTAYRLANFVRWSAASHMHGGAPIDLGEVTEAHLDEFACDLESGAWSDDGDELSAAYIANLQVAGIDLLQWMAHFKYRQPLELVSADHVRESEKGRIYTRHYSVVRRANPRDFDFPPDDAHVRVLKNLNDIADKLACVTVFQAGLRASEACGLAATAIPLSPAGTAYVRFDVLGKGNRTRKVAMSAELIPTFRSYYTEVRPERLEKCKRIYGRSSSDYELAKSRLLLNSRDGRALSYTSFWRAFKQGAKIGNLPDLSPHLGRHWYAGAQLKARHARVGNSPNLADQLAPVLQGIRIQLGHRSIETTQIYLDAYLRQHAALAVALPYQDELIKALAL